MLVRRAFVPQGLQPDSFAAWPFSVPCVAEFATHGLTLTEPVTMLVGENGSGKSTLVEAIAEGFKLDAHGGRANPQVRQPTPEDPSWAGAQPGNHRFRGADAVRAPLPAERVLPARRNCIRADSGMAGYWGRPTPPP